MQQFQDLPVGIAHHALAGHVAVCLTHTCEKQAQQVVDLRDRPHRAPRVPADGLLFNGDHRAQAADQVHIRPFDTTEELPRIGIEGLDVPALSFGVYGVEGQGALATPAQSGDHHQAVAGNTHIDVLQVVHPGPQHFDVLRFAVLVLKLAFDRQVLDLLRSCHGPFSPS